MRRGAESKRSALKNVSYSRDLCGRVFCGVPWPSPATTLVVTSFSQGLCGAGCRALCSQLPDSSCLLLALQDGGEGPSFFKMPRRLANQIRWEMALEMLMGLTATRPPSKPYFFHNYSYGTPRARARSSGLTAGPDAGPACAYPAASPSFL